MGFSTKFRSMAAGAALAMGVSLLSAAPALAQANVVSAADAVQSLRNALNIQTGSTGEVYGGDGSAVCPGATPTGSENIYDFNQDGIPDYAAMALISHLIDEGDAQVIASINEARAAWEVPLAQLGGATGVQAIGQFNPFASPTDVSGAADAFAYYMVSDLSAATVIGCNNDTLGAAIGEMVSDHIDPSSDLAPVVGANNDLNGDGITLLSNWNQAVATIAGGAKVFVLDDQPFLDTVELFIDLATEEVTVACPECTPTSATEFDAGDTLCIGVDAPGGFGFTWSRNGNALNNTSRISGVTCPILRITDLAVTDAGTYRIDYDDGNKAPVFQEFTVTVIPQAGLPVAGGLGLALLVGMSALLGASALRRKH